MSRAAAAIRQRMVFHRTTHLLESAIDFARDPRSTAGIRRCVRDMGDMVDGYGVSVLDVREELQLADAIDRADRQALAAQIRRIATKVHALALVEADEIAKEGT